MDIEINSEDIQEKYSLDAIPDAVYEESINDDVLCRQVNWLYVLKNNILTDGQIIKYKEYINNYFIANIYTKWWSIISYQSHLSEFILETYWLEMNSPNNIKLLIYKKKLSVSFIQKHFADIKNAGIWSIYSFSNKFYSNDERKIIKSMFDLYSDLV